MNLVLTNEQKQEIVDLYNDDFYVEYIIDYFCELCPQIVNEVRLKVMKDYGYTNEDWNWACEEMSHFNCEASEMIEEVELDTMHELLEMFDVDTRKDYD